MYTVLLKRHIVSILPMSDSFHYHVKLLEYVKMSDALLKLNYSHYAPFQNPEILSWYDGQFLHLWFYETTSTTPIIIPEAYLLFQQLKHSYKNQAVVLQGEIYKIFMIQEGNLQSAFVSDTYNEQLLRLSLDQNALSEITTLDAEVSKNIYTQAIDALTIQELLRWKNNSIDYKTLFYAFLERLALPATVLMVVILGLNLVHDQLLTQKLQKLETEYKSFKNSNDAVRSEIRKKKAEQKRWNTFIQEELLFPDVMTVLETIIHALPDDKSSIKAIEIVNGLVTMTIESNSNPIMILNRLIEIKIVKNVVIKKSYKPKRKKRVIIYEMDLLPVGGLHEL